MRSKLVNGNPKTYVLVFETGDEVIEGLTAFASANSIAACGLTAIGALSKVEVGYFDFSIKDYKPIHITEQVEVLSLIGDISLYENEPKIHAHVVVGKADGTAHGGHLLKAYVNPTLEVVLTELPAYLNRVRDEASGIPLIKL